MKLFKKIALFVATAAIGVGTLYNHDILKAKADGSYISLFGANYNSKDVSSYTATFSSTNNGFTVNLENFNNNNNAWNYVKCGRKDNASVAHIKTNSAIEEVVSSVVITIDAVTSSKINSIYLKTYNGDYSGTPTNSIQCSKIATGDYTFNITNKAENLKYDLVFDCAAGSSNGLLTLSKISYNYESTAVSTTGVSLNKSSVSLYEGKTETLIATVSPNNASNKNVSWSSNNPSVATVNNGLVTAVSEGNATITVTTEEGNFTATCEVRVNAMPSLHAGTLEDPLTVADARTLIDNNLQETSKRYYVKGVFLKYFNNDNTKNSYYICDSLDNQENDLELYLDKFPFVPRFTVGEEIIASATAANIIKYNTTYEFKNSELYNPVVDLQVTVNKSFTQIGEVLTKEDLTVVAKYKHDQKTITDYKINNGESAVLSNANNVISISYTNTAMNSSFFGEKSATKEISINGLASREVTGVQLTGSLTKNSYTNEDSSWDLSGLNLEVSYNFGSNLTLDINDSRVSVVTDPLVPSVGVTSVTVTATFEGFNATETYDVTVKKNPFNYQEIAYYTVTTAKNNGDEYTDANDFVLTSGRNIITSATSSGKVYVGVAANNGGLTEGRKDLIRFGSSSAAGSIEFTLNENISRIVISAKSWSNSACDVKVSNTTEAALNVGYNSFENLTFNFSTAVREFTLSCNSGARFMVESIKFMAKQSMDEILNPYKTQVEESKTRLKMSYDYQALEDDDMIFSNIHVSMGAVIEKTLIDEINEIDEVIEIGVEVLKNNYVSYSSTTKTYKKQISNYTTDMSALRTDNKANVTATGDYYSWWATIKFLTDNTHSIYSDEFLDNIELLTDITFTAKAYVKTASNVKLYLTSAEEYSVQSLAEAYFLLGFNVPGLEDLATL
ncbi:MAG: Ig-like domain-containing protein [Bacilli bacterium]|nr:Ig-like domain-containing protein [Bacilli bacterium]